MYYRKLIKSKFNKWAEKSISGEILKNKPCRKIWKECIKIGRIKKVMPRVESTAGNFHLMKNKISAQCLEFPSVSLKGRREN